MNVFGSSVTKQQTVSNWFAKFRTGYFDLNNEPRVCSELKVIIPVSSAGEIRYDFMKPGSPITTEIYCNQLDEMMQKLKEKQPRSVNKSTPILLHDNVRLHAAQMIVAKLQELELELLHHPPYSSDLVPTVCHFFHNLNNFLIRKQFNSDNVVKLVCHEFIDSRPPGFYVTDLNNLPFKWQKCIDNMGAYFDE
nr:histone-lysine N-methyltransferase SETMAR-like [Megalopta genalis]